MKLFFSTLIFIFFLSNYTLSYDLSEKVIKDRIYELVKIQYYKDSKNNLNYYSINENKSLAACLDWTTLTNYFNKSQKKFYKKIIWGSSYGKLSSKKETIQNCQLRSLNKKNCICQIIDNQNVNSVTIPEFVFGKLNIDRKKNVIKESNIDDVEINQELQKKMNTLKDLLDNDLITKIEFDNKRQVLLGINNEEIIIKNTENNKIVKNDNEGPSIEVKEIFTADQSLIALIEGSVYDDNEVALVVVDGDPVSVIDGKFSQKLFVKPEGQNIIITAMDKYGNKTNTSAKLIRSNIIVKKKEFDFLNPTLIKNKINTSAVALIIGIEEYENTFSAKFAKNDALVFNDFVHTSFGVPKENIKLLMNNEAGRTNTLKTLVKWLPKVVKENKTDVYLFFSGHGLASEDGEDLYLLPSDGDPDLLEESTLKRNKLFDRIAKLNPRSVTVFLDTCYSGATRTEEFLVAAKPIFIEAKEQNIPTNFTVFSASAARETAKVLDEAEHGLFSYYMMKGLEGDADSNSDNQITNGELLTFIKQNVLRQANQTPQLNGNPDQVIVSW